MRLLTVNFLTSLWRAMGRRRAAALILLSLSLVLEAGLLTLLLPTIHLVVQPDERLGSAA